MVFITPGTRYRSRPVSLEHDLVRVEVFPAPSTFSTTASDAPDQLTSSDNQRSHLKTLRPSGGLA